MAEPHDWNQHYATGHMPWDSGAPSMEMQRVIAEYAITPRRTLEFGCGTGTNAIWLAQQGFDVTAVDVAPLAIEQAVARAKAAGVIAPPRSAGAMPPELDFRVANLLDPADVTTLGQHGPYPFVFDRGVYHCLREENLAAILRAIERLTSAGSLYLLLAGNANDTTNAEQGPPRVHAHELTAELDPLFDLIQLREFRFDGVMIDGTAISPLAWSALWRRK
jgi:SAM-dependent methyltransferase